MAVIKKALPIVTCGLTLLFYQACSVDVDKDTPGALSCNPTEAQVTAFHNNPYKSHIQPTCGVSGCHGNGSPTKGYMLLNPEPSDTDLVRQTENYCMHLNTSNLVSFPSTSPTHPNVNVQPIVDWLETL